MVVVPVIYNPFLVLDTLLNLKHKYSGRLLILIKFSAADDMSLIAVNGENNRYGSAYEDSQ